MSAGNPPAGYYADPSIPGYIRYWDGDEWVAGTSRPAPDEVAQQVAEQAPASSQGGAHAKQAVEQPQDSGTWQPEPAAPTRTEAEAEAAGARSQAAEPQRAGQSQIGQIPSQGQAQGQSKQYGQASPQDRVPRQAQAQAQAQPQQYAQPSAQAQFQPQQYAPTPQPQRAPLAPGVFPMSASVPPPTAAPPSGSAAPQAAEASGTMMIPSAFGSTHTGTFRLPGTNSNPFAGLPGSAYPAADVDVDGERSGAETTVVELATPGSRFLARIIDLGIAAVFSAPITVSLLLVAHRHDHQYVLKLDQQATTTYTALGMDGLGIALWAGALLALILVSILYEGIRLGRGGQTFGKRLAGVRVVRLQDGRPLGRGDAGTRRALLFWVLAILPLIDILTLGGVLWGRPYRQGMHEKATSTATVKA